MRYEREKLKIIGLQNAEPAAKHFDTIKAIIEESQNENNNSIEKLYDCSIDAFMAGFIVGKQEERARRKNHK